jgi:hypothetical protein
MDLALAEKSSRNVSLERLTEHFFVFDSVSDNHSLGFRAGSCPAADSLPKQLPMGAPVSVLRTEVAAACPVSESESCDTLFIECESDMPGVNQAEGSEFCSQTELNAGRSDLHFDGNLLPDQPGSQSVFFCACDDEEKLSGIDGVDTIGDQRS